MQLIAKQNGREIWARYVPDAEIWELYFDQEGETYTGWYVDTIIDAMKAARYIFEEMLEI